MNSEAMLPSSRILPIGAGMVFAMSLTHALGGGIVYLRPIAVGALIDGFRFSPAQAGVVVGVEQAGAGLATLAAALVAGRSDRRGLALLGAGLMVLGSLAPLLAHSFSAIVFERLAGGAGCGIVAAVTAAVLAGAPKPDRAFGLLYAFTSAGGALLVPSTAKLAHTSGPAGVYFVMAALGLAALIGCSFIPRSASTSSAPASRVLLADKNISILLVSLIFWMGTGAAWAFAERVGVSHNFSETMIGNALGAGQVTGLAGALAASAVALRFGRLVPMASATGVLVLSALSILYSQALTGFVAGLLAFNFACLAFLTYITGMMATHDASGRIVVLGIVSLSLGLALGPLVGGLLASRWGFSSVLWLAMGCHLIAFGILLRSLIPAANSIRAESAPPP